VVDEVLAVGDAGFQARCAQRLLQFRDEGRTMIMVSHVTAILRNVADRLLWLDQGVVRMIGSVAAVADAYESEVRQRIARHRLEEHPAVASSSEADPMPRLQSGECRVGQVGQGPVMDVVLRWFPPGREEVWTGEWALQYCLQTETGIHLDEGRLPLPIDPIREGRELTLRFDPLPLMPGTYELVLSTPRINPDQEPFRQRPGSSTTLHFRIPGSRFAADLFPVDMPVTFRLLTPDESDSCPEMGNNYGEVG
jgi:ABC-2 type transport system ATP-binding protein